MGLGADLEPHRGAPSTSPSAQPPASSAQQHVENDLSQVSSMLTQLADNPDAAAHATTRRRGDLAGPLQTYASDVQSLADALQQAAAATL